MHRRRGIERDQSNAGRKPQGVNLLITFGQFFEQATGKRPFPYQERLAAETWPLLGCVYS
jgi:hypothetical protein